MSSLLLVVIFIGSAAVIWAAGILLSNATDALDGRLGLGSALGGLLLLAIATNLPELAITITAAARGNLSLAVGNLVGGIAIQTLVLAFLDLRAGRTPLTYQVGSLTVVLEASIVLGTLGVAVMGTQLPASVALGPVSPASLAILGLWVGVCSSFAPPATGCRGRAGRRAPLRDARRQIALAAGNLSHSTDVPLRLWPGRSCRPRCSRLQRVSQSRKQGTSSQDELDSPAPCSGPPCSPPRRRCPSSALG